MKQIVFVAVSTMKPFLLFSLFFTVSQTLPAQPSYEVIETPKVLNGNWQNSYTVNIPGVSANMIEKAWSDQMTQAGGLVLEVAGSDVQGFLNVTLPILSDQSLEVFFDTYEDTEEASTHFTVWFSRNGQFISTRKQPDSFRPISRLLLEFSFQVEDDLKKNIQIEDQQKATQAFPKIKN